MAGKTLFAQSVLSDDTHEHQVGIVKLDLDRSGRESAKLVVLEPILGGHIGLGLDCVAIVMGQSDSPSRQCISLYSPQLYLDGLGKVDKMNSSTPAARAASIMISP